MKHVFTERMTSSIDGEFVVFIVGMRINKTWKIHKWIPVMLQMPKMLNQLYANPEYGLLSHESWFGRTTIMLQYWRSFEHLEKYAKNKNAAHLPAWSSFLRKVGSNGDVGIWHETYLVKANNYESIYSNMPPFGLAKAGVHMPVTNRSETARQRLDHET